MASIVTELRVTVEHWRYDGLAYQDRVFAGAEVVVLCLVRHKTPEAAQRCGEKRKRGYTETV